MKSGVCFCFPINEYLSMTLVNDTHLFGQVLS